jgi:hypothetical protein
MRGWGGEEQASYGDDAACDQQYVEGGNHGKERPPKREWSGAPERRREREKDMAPAQDWLGRGVVMSKTWPETGIVTLTEIGSEIVIGRGKKSKTGKGIGTGMRETDIAIITGTGNAILNVMKIGIGEGHLGCAVSQGRLIIPGAGAMRPK